MMKFTLPPVVCKGQYHNTESIMAIVEQIAITPRAIMGPQWHSLFNSWRFSNLITEQNVPILVRKNAFLALKNYGFPFSVHTFPCATSPCAFLNCHAFKLCADYAIFTVTHSELFILTRRIQYLGLKPNLKKTKWESSVKNFYYTLYLTPVTTSTKASHKCTTIGWVSCQMPKRTTFIQNMVQV